MSRRPPKSSVGVDGPQQTCASKIGSARSSGAHRRDKFLATKGEERDGERRGCYRGERTQG